MPNVKARIINKHDTEANWASAVNFTPLAGEVIVYDVDANHAYPRFKVGDGKTLVSALPFSTDVLTNYVTETELASALNETTSAINKNIATIDDEVATHVAATNNPHQVTKTQIGLSNVDNVKQYSASNPPPYGTLTFTGAVEDSFTASTSKTIEIPTIAGPTGPTGADGQDGDNGYTWIPSVASNGMVSWTSTQAGPGSTPASVNIMGPAGADGQDGAVGPAANIIGATASITGGHGTPSVVVTPTGDNQSRSFSFAFSNLVGATGNTGATGAAAGFGTPTASVTTGNPGTSASVTVNATGSNTAKVFDFEFTIPRGNTGAVGPAANITGATATITNTVGTPTVTVTPSGTNQARTFAFAFSNLRGATGPIGPTGSVANVSQSGTGFVSSITLNSSTKVLEVTRTIVTIDNGEL